MYCAAMFSPTWETEDWTHCDDTLDSLLAWIKERDEGAAPIGLAFIVCRVETVHDMAGDSDWTPEQWNVGKPMLIIWRGEILYKRETGS